MLWPTPLHFKEEVKRCKSVIANIKTYFITDNAADKGGITDALKQVQQNAKANDVLYFIMRAMALSGKTMNSISCRQM